jgi:hypothetical protein
MTCNSPRDNKPKSVIAGLSRPHHWTVNYSADQRSKLQARFRHIISVTHK